MTTKDPLSDLLGGSERAEPPRTERRDLRVGLLSRGQKIDSEVVGTAEVDEGPFPTATDFVRPVGVSFIAEVFKKQPYQIKKRLARCPVIGTHKVSGKDQPLYDFLTAVSFLLEPKGDIEEWFAQKNAATLPPYVNKMFWDSAAQRNRVMRESNDLWHTEDVMVVLGRVGLTIKEESQQWIEELPERDLLSDAQYKALLEAVYRLQSTLRDALVDMPSHFKTYAMSDTIREELTESGRLPDSQTE
jgi:hypothetical protein